MHLLGILCVVAGGLNVLIGLSLLSLGVGAFALLGGADSGRMAAGLTAATFVVIAVIALLWGLICVAAGVALRRMRPAARLFGLAVSVVNLFLLPFGTALGAYGLWVLLQDGARPLFEPA